MLEWKDTTSYSRDDPVREPKTFTARAGDIAITVTCDHIYYRGKWILQCTPFYREYELKVTTEDQAKAKALQLVRNKIKVIVSALAD